MANPRWSSPNDFFVDADGLPVPAIFCTLMLRSPGNLRIPSLYTNMMWMLETNSYIKSHTGGLVATPTGYYDPNFKNRFNIIIRVSNAPTKKDIWNKIMVELDPLRVLMKEHCSPYVDRVLFFYSGMSASDFDKYNKLDASNSNDKNIRNKIYDKRNMDQWRSWWNSLVDEVGEF